MLGRTLPTRTCSPKAKLAVCQGSSFYNGAVISPSESSHLRLRSFWNLKIPTLVQYYSRHETKTFACKIKHNLFIVVSVAYKIAYEIKPEEHFFFLYQINFQHGVLNIQVYSNNTKFKTVLCKACVSKRLNMHIVCYFISLNVSPVQVYNSCIFMCIDVGIFKFTGSQRCVRL